MPQAFILKFVLGYKASMPYIGRVWRLERLFAGENCKAYSFWTRQS